MANSTTSKPLITEPFASSIVLPCSSEIIFARTSIFFSIISLYLEIILERFKGVVFDQSKKRFENLLKLLQNLS